jgi:pimeloyl-ACP methyl ester carboxylesterase
MGGMKLKALAAAGAMAAAIMPAAPALAQSTAQAAPAAPAVRPQNPVKPYPYKEVEASYDNKARPGVHLAGTLTVPQGKGPFPTVLLITGSGPQDRDETIFDHKPFLILSDHLTRRGVAVLRVDDRGVGGSTGAGANDTSNDYATDVQAGIDWLKTRPEVDAKRIGLIGHSEGGLIAPIVAKDNPDVAFALLWAGTGVSGADVIVEQVRAVAASSGATAEAAAAAAAKQRELVDSILKAKDQDTAYQAALKIAMSDGTTEAQAAPAVKFLAGGWFRNFLVYDPGPTLRSLHIPVLALLGGKDVQVLATQNGPAMEAAFAGNPKAKVMTLPGLNHLFQNASSGSPMEYGTITETIDPAALKLMCDWVVEVTQAGSHTAH